ncbi:MAG TPA: 6-pyruvoyl-tetrahydropterin synthase-related protein [Promineifilum sp.]|nr:glycosyltransferase family 39 protein [Promineifilum sp.]HNS38873.1 6-pyruvoyl-tetrahydropterin synthase-related protein [Promineifilum sp.]
MINRIRRGFDPGFLIVLLICVLAVWPLISRASLPEGTDAELHIFRLHELSYLIRGGEFYPRWAPDFYHGYGYPIFNYYAPLIYYLALPFELLPSVDATLASKIVLVIGMILAGVGLYGFVRDNWGRRAGYVAAALYVYSPYIQYIDPYIRGALPEAFSFGVFPLALWTLDRLRHRRSAVSWVASVLAVAAVILSHNLMGLFFFGFLASWVVWHAGLAWWQGRQTNGQGDWPAVGRMAAAMLLGLGLAAFFWLPVFMERNAVTLNTLIGQGGHYDFRTHFLSLRDLLAFSQRPDWGATQSPFRFNLGVVQGLLGLLGVAALLLGRARERAQLLFFTLALVVVTFLMLPISEPVWDAIPFLPFFQFPWRLLGAAAALLAILGAAGVEMAVGWVGTRSHRGSASSWLYAAATALPMILALPLSQPAAWEPFGEVNTLRMSLIENSGRWLGTTSTADYVPATVIMLPDRRNSVVAPIQQGLPPDRVNYDAMPDGAAVLTEVVRPLLTRYHVTAPKQFRLRLFLFDFPGWQVTVDGQPAETEIAEPEGFIVVLVPQGEHVVEVKFGSTPARTMSWLVSLFSLGIALAGAWRIKRTPDQTVPRPGNESDSIRADGPIIVVVGGIVLLAILLEPLGFFHYHSEGRELDIPAISTHVNFGDQIILLGYNASAASLRPGATLDLTLYWQAQRSLDIDYQVFVHILDANGVLVAQSDKINPGEFPTHRWPLNKYVPDIHHITLPASLPSGEYTVATGMWVQSEGWRLPVFDSSGQTIGDRADLFTLRVK